MRVAIVTDSNSGITQEQGRQAGIYVVPMPFMMAGETYFEDISLTQKSFYERLAEGADISTSQPSIRVTVRAVKMQFCWGNATHCL